MWQRFTKRARRMLFNAREEAERLEEPYVSTEHILLGLVREDDSTAAGVLDGMGISLDRIRREVERQVTRSDGLLGKDTQLSPRAKRVIDLAYDEARQQPTNYIGSEHLLLGLIREGDGLAARILGKLGVDLERARMQVAANLPIEALLESEADLDSDSADIMRTRDEGKRAQAAVTAKEALRRTILDDNAGWRKR